MKKLVVFASGSGSNAENLVNYVRKSEGIEVVAIFCNKPQAYVIERGKKLQVPVVLFSFAEFQNPVFLAKLNGYQPDFIILAGFLLKIPPYITQIFPSRILNIHPSLLPKYGGKGMYGAHVHEEVIKNKETSSGITIHLVNEHYDEGTILFQAMCDVTSTDTPDSLAAKVHELEYKHFPQIISDYISDFRG